MAWDGTCDPDGTNSDASLSNGWQPVFQGASACVIALDGCSSDPCTTRITYGSNWLPAPNHPAQYDDVNGRVSWDRGCKNSGSNSSATLSNGWTPTFSGSNACALSFEYTACGGLYLNPVVDTNCPDPGVLVVDGGYVMACTSGNAAAAFPIRTSSDLVNWTQSGAIFASGHRPSWAASDFWAPEIHHVGSGYVAYFTARASNGRLSIGAATASSPLGPFTDLGAPLVQDPSLGLIDATEFEDSSGTPYLVWKVDGNAVGQHTPIKAAQLSADGTQLVGSTVQLITNDESWEGGVTEGPWVVAHGGDYYLFYSGNSYANSTYAVGVARATAPLGPYTKLGSPILTSNASWIGPGHCSVVQTPDGDWEMVYHAWIAGHVNGPGDGRVDFVDQIVWSNGWPSVPQAPSTHSRPMP